MNDFIRGYMECALWSSTDESTPEGGNPMDDNYGIEDIAPEAVKQIEEDCNDFQQANTELLAEAKTIRKTYDDAHAGHDFWLTRNHHGAGFWDRGLGEVGEKLSAAAHVYGDCNLYVGDDGKVYC